MLGLISTKNKLDRERKSVFLFFSSFLNLFESTRSLFPSYNANRVQPYEQ